MIEREAEISLILNTGLSAKIGDITSVDRMFTHILSDPGLYSCGHQEIDPEMVAIKLSTNMDLFAKLLNCRVNFNTEANYEITFGGRKMGYPGRKEITVEGLVRIYRLPGDKLPILYLYPGLVPCIIRSITWADTNRNEMRFIGSVNIDKELGYA